MLINYLKNLKKRCRPLNDPTGDLSCELELLDELRKVQKEISELKNKSSSIPSLHPNMMKLLDDYNISNLSFEDALKEIQNKLSNNETFGYTSDAFGDYEPWEGLADYFQKITDICKSSKEKNDSLFTLQEKEFELKMKLGLK